MKKLFHYLSVFAIAALTLTGCDDVPMPYNQPEIKPDEPSAEVTPKGSGTAADPYNVAAVLQVIQGLEGDNTTDQIYVKGVVKNIRQIETEQYGNANYYITDDGNNQVYIFQSYYLGNRKFTANDRLEAGDTVVVCGKFYNYNGNTPETVGRGTSYIYSLNGKTSGGDTPTPTPTPGEALSISGTTVTITSKGVTAGETTASVDFSTLGLSNAEDVTTKPFELTDGTKITFSANGQTNGPKYYNGTKGIRVYLNNIITFKGSKKIAKIVMSCDSYSGTDYVGNKGATVAFSGNDVVYTNSDESVTSGGGVQLRVKTITITYAK